MNRKFLIAATAIAAVAGLSFTAPGVSVAGALPADVQTQLNAVCYALKNPNDHANFTALAVSIIQGDPVIGQGTVVGTPVVVTIPGGVSGTSWSALYRNGQSPNLFSTLTTTFAPGSVTTTTNYIGPVNFTFGCQYFNQNGNHTEGQDTFGNTGTAVTTYQTIVTEGGGAPVTTADEMVVCISPSGPAKKGNPGVWRIQNGWTGTTADCAAKAASLPPIPSNSLP